MEKLSSFLQNLPHFWVAEVLATASGRWRFASEFGI